MSEIDNERVGLVGGIKEGSMADVVPDVEVEVAKVGIHEGLELLAVDVMVHGAMENEVGKGLLILQQGSLVLGVINRPSTDIWVLPGNGTHPRVLDTLVEFIPIGNTRLGKRLSGGAESVERIEEQARDEAQNPWSSDIGQHIAVGEGAHEDNTANDIGTVVRSDISGSDATHGPTIDVIRSIQ